ncbi:amino acid permease [uncultured Propionibacterium sp.]|uniref:amino acid permease n=1 Tax=uncultured Propionibacterium sp. TaxID=218066 RepID=UPI00292D0ECF|nr:amino acid permease [uncultured Propionibacterium sp.]
MSRHGALRLKPIEDILAQQSADAAADAVSPGVLKRQLTVRDLLGLGIGMVIGTGIFTLTGIEARNHASPAVTISYALAGFIALLAALCYCEMASAVPTAGSAYTYAYATLGEIFAWIIGWDLVLEFALGAGVVSRGWSGYLKSLFGLPDAFFGETSRINLGGVFIAVLLGLIAMIGAKESARVTNTLVVIKVTICVFIIAVGLFFIRAANYSPFIPAPAATTEDGRTGWETSLVQAVTGVSPSTFGLAGILTAAAVVFFAYSGFEVVANMGEETRDPQRDLVRGVLGTLGICTGLYVAVCLVVTGMVKYADIDEGAPVAEAFKSVGLGWAGALIAVAAICGLTSVILVDIVGMGRIAFAMGRDGLLPMSVARVHPRWGTPYRVIALTTALVAALAGFVPLRALADMVSIGTLFAFVVVSAAVPILRRTRPDLERPFRVPFSPVLPIASVLACLYMMMNLSLATWMRFLVWMAIGLVIYLGYGRRHALARRHEREQDAEVATTG